MKTSVQLPENYDPRFGSGPSKVPTRFIEQLLETQPHYLGTSHRRPMVVSLVQELHENLRSFFELPADFEILIGNGGASFFFDMIGLGLVEKKSHHFCMGEFSHKWLKAHQNIPWIETEVSEVDYGKGIEVTAVDADTICCTLNETSTGVITKSFPKVDRHTLLAVDATSGSGQVPCDISKVDVYFFGPQKVFASEGGTYLAFLSPKAIARAQKIAKSNRYIPTIMDFAKTLEFSKKFQTLNTPSLSTLFYLNCELTELNARGGYPNLLKEAREKADLIYSWAEKHPKLRPLVDEPSFRSTACATLLVDESIDLKSILDQLRGEKLVYDIEGYRKVETQHIRIGLFDQISLQDLKGLTDILSLYMT